MDAVLEFIKSIPGNFVMLWKMLFEKGPDQLRAIIIVVVMAVLIIWFVKLQWFPDRCWNPLVPLSKISLRRK
jgi:hypothetical protein